MAGKPTKQQSLIFNFFDIPENEKYLKKYLKYFSVYLHLKVFVFESLKSI